MYGGYPAPITKTTAGVAMGRTIGRERDNRFQRIIERAPELNPGLRWLTGNVLLRNIPILGPRRTLRCCFLGL